MPKYIRVMTAVYATGPQVIQGKKGRDRTRADRARCKEERSLGKDGMGFPYHIVIFL